MARTLGDDRYCERRDARPFPPAPLFPSRERGCPCKPPLEKILRPVRHPYLSKITQLIRACRCWRRQLDPPDLEKFVLWNDRHLYEKDIGRVYLTDKAHIRLFNSSSSLNELHQSLEELNLADEQRLRPNWDQYFMQLASLAAQRSNCMKRRVGCVLVRERRVISTGYNGTPRHLTNCNEGGCTRTHSRLP